MRELPVTYREILQIRKVYRPTLSERLKIAFGYNVFFEARICTQHRCGQTKQMIKCEPTSMVTEPPSTEAELQALVARQANEMNQSLGLN